MLPCYKTRVARVTLYGVLLKGDCLMNAIWLLKFQPFHGEYFHTRYRYLHWVCVFCRSVKRNHSGLNIPTTSVQCKVNVEHFYDQIYNTFSTASTQVRVSELVFYQVTSPHCCYKPANIVCEICNIFYC